MEKTDNNAEVSSAQVQENLQKKFNIQPVEMVAEEIDSETGLTMSDRAKLIATGLLFNFADEAIAGIKALSPDITYDEALAKERSQIKSAQEKEGSLKYEIGGAFIPTAVALAAAPFTGGTSVATTAPTWMRLLGIGATQGFTMGLGASEEEGLDRLKDTPVSTLTGMVANPLFSKLASGVQIALMPLIDYTRRTLTGKVGKKVEDELIRIVTDSGLTVDEIIERVARGEIIPEMSEDAAKVIGSFITKAGPGNPIIREAVSSRKNQFIEDVYKSLQKDLAPESKGGNIYKTFSENAELMLKKESAAYNEIWDSTAGQTFRELDQAVLFIVGKSRGLRNVINKKLDENGFQPLFKLKGKNLELTRSLSLEEGEIIKRALMDKKNAAFTGGKGDSGATFGNYENSIKSVLDQISPELANVRNNWRLIKEAAKQYDIGKTIINKNPEEIAVQFQKLVDSGNLEAIDALRSGVASSLKFKSQAASPVGTVTKLADRDLGINSKEREILEIIYPGEKIESIIEKINKAKGAVVAESKMFGGSPSAERLGMASRVGEVAGGMADVARVVNSAGMDIGATTSLITRIFGGKKPPFTDEEYVQIAKLLIEENPEVLRRAMTDETALDSVLGSLATLIRSLGASQPRVTALTDSTENIGEPIDASISASLEAIINTMSPSSKEKVLDAGN